MISSLNYNVCILKPTDFYPSKPKDNDVANSIRSASLKGYFNKNMNQWVVFVKFLNS